MGEVVDDARPNRVWVQFGSARLGSSASSESQADDGSTWAVLTALSASASLRVNCRSVGETSAASRSVGPNTSQPRARPNVTAHAAGRRRGVDVAAVQDHAGSQEGFARPRRVTSRGAPPLATPTKPFTVGMNHPTSWSQQRGSSQQLHHEFAWRRGLPRSLRSPTARRAALHRQAVHPRTGWATTAETARPRPWPCSPSQRIA